MRGLIYPKVYKVVNRGLAAIHVLYLYIHSSILEGKYIACEP